MRITASQIVSWVENHSKEAQVELPRLIRRLCFCSSVNSRQISFPAGDSTYTPGWDGVLSCGEGDAWVPEGDSYWEMGCDKGVTTKANEDYKKRIDKMDQVVRDGSTFVFVSPRRWSKKAEWIKQKNELGEWRRVIAYDADDIEQWLEASPSVALQFAEEIGLRGNGIESLEHYWRLWSQQCNPPILPDALFTDRVDVCKQLVEKLNPLSPHSERVPLTIVADSEGEASAFAIATLLNSSRSFSQAIVVTSKEGWRYVDANEQIKIVVAATTEVAEMPSSRVGVQVIIPYAQGALVQDSHDGKIVLERPNVSDFEKALVSIGIEESDATRLANNTGRSWSVFRRHRANNPAIRKPGWLDQSFVPSLVPLCLIGAWNGSNEVDRSIVEEVVGIGYEDIESNLRYLASLDDAPILLIGSVWKAKSPLELLDILGRRLTNDQLDRFFSVVNRLLALSDPQLELPDSERWVAQVHGKVRPQSGFIYDSICDSLIKLVVRGGEQTALANLGIETKVSVLVFDLLEDADDIRWLSLASYLPALAEAAPESFLSAVEKSFQQPNAPVTQLIKETTDAGVMGRCWHSGLLWALETLAWAPNRLSRVVLILAQLCKVPYKSNWSNTPSSSLHGIFRTWFPQTAADIKQRIAVLDLLIKREPEIAFDVLENLTDKGPGYASPAAHPNWRDDDAGCGDVTYEEMHDMHSAARERMYLLSDGDAKKIVKLLDNISLSDKKEINRALSLTRDFLKPEESDEDREKLCKVLRKKIHWHRNYDDVQGDELDNRLAEIEKYYLRLTPINPLYKYRWLFSDPWIELPVRDRGEDIEYKVDERTEARVSALNDLYDIGGIDLIEGLIEICGNPSTVGATLAVAKCNEDNWVSWIVESGGDFIVGSKMSICINSLLGRIEPEHSLQLIKDVVGYGKGSGWSVEKISRFFVLTPFSRNTWDIVHGYGKDIELSYWGLVNPYYFSSDSEDDQQYILKNLLGVKRPRAALQTCEHKLKKMDAQLLLASLQQLLAGEEPDGRLIDSWHFGEMLEVLESSDEIEKDTLLQLEFALFPALNHGDEHKASALYHALMSEPEVFVELIAILYKPANRENDEPVDDANKSATSTVWKVFHHCRRQPGTDADGNISEDAYIQFIEDTRRLCEKADRLVVCDISLGEIIAHCPKGNDGVWPFKPACEILDRPEMKDIRRGFMTGVRNKRGVTSRSVFEGGDQERDLAKFFMGNSQKLQMSYPNVAALLEKISVSYVREGSGEDVRAVLRKEGF